jgi:enamine deaminase RidA (YjgF/YER057c/UK114 family)
MIEEKLKSLNITLPSPPKPAGAYIPVVKSGNTMYVSGQIPIEDGKVTFNGKVPSVQSLEQAQKAARLCAINALAQLKSELGSLDKISKILRVSGFVNSESDFTEQPKVINAASDLLFEIFGTVEIDMIVEIS